MIVETPPSQNDWQIVAASDFVNGSYIQAGTIYTTMPGNSLPHLVYLTGGAGCSTTPTGSFTIVDLTYTGGDQAIVEQLLLWWDLTCDDAGVTGCVGYGM